MPKTNEIKFLGVIIDEKLTFKPQINQIGKKVSQAIGAIKRISRFIPCNSISSLYNGLVQSRISYAIPAYGSAARTHVAKLQSLQNKIGSLITYRGTEDFFAKNLNVENLFAYFTVIKFFKCYQLSQHQHFVTAIDELVPTHRYPTRAREDDRLNTPFYRTNRCQQSFLFHAIQKWNSLPNSIKTCTTLESFKFNCKSYLLSLQ